MFSLKAILLATALTGAGDAVLLDFTATWCGPCRAMAPTVRRLAGEGYDVRKVDIDQHRQLAAQYQVRGVPCFVMLAGGREVDRVVGATTYDRLVRMFQTAGATTSAAASATAPARQAAAPATSAPRPSATKPLVAVPHRSATPQHEHPRQLPPDQLALQATVRLKVEDPHGHSYGTGTIVDVHGDEALVLTCGHIFRDSKGTGRITVDFCAPGATGPVPGQLLAYEADRRDIGLVVIRTSMNIRPVRVASPEHRAVVGNRVFSVGCDRGGKARIQHSRLSGINKYLGPANFEVAGAPVDGRSGGGLFSADGALIGVCNAADPADNEGIYAALPVVHWQLARIGQERIYQREPTAVAQNTPASTVRPTRDASPEDTTPAGFDAKLDDAELICIIRSRTSPQAQSQVMVLDQLPPELAQQLAREYHRRMQQSAAENQAGRVAVRPYQRRSGDVVRAQSED